jgi:hypothetical protein
VRVIRFYCLLACFMKKFHHICLGGRLNEKLDRICHLLVLMRIVEQMFSEMCVKPDRLIIS